MPPPPAARARLGLPLRPGTYRISSGFGPRGSSMHRGVDFAAPLGTPIYAVADGTVVEARGAWRKGEPGWVNGFGCWLWTRHTVDGQTVDVIVGHMTPDGLLVKTGQRVTAGQLVGRVGNHGDSTGAHAHVECWVGGTAPRLTGSPVDPMPWLEAT